MSDKADKVADKITEEYGRLFQAFGVKPTMMDIYLSIFFSEKPAGQKEISEKTGYGISTVTNTMPIIEKIFDVKHFKKPKSKKILYECKHDAFEIFMKKMAYQLATMKEIKLVLKTCEQELEGGKTGKALRYKEYVHKLCSDYDKMIRIFERHNEYEKEMR